MENVFPLEISVLSSNALREFISGEYFSHALLECRLFYRGLHDIYRVITGKKEYFFKVYRQGIRSMEDIQAEVDLLNFLKLSDIEITAPVIKSDGKFISRFNTANGIRYGVLYTSVGKHEFNQIEETPELNERLGSYIAAIHNAWDKCELEINRWNLDAHSFIDKSMNAIRQFSTIHDFDMLFLEEVAKNVNEKLGNLTIERPQYGMCHGDIYSGNIRVDANNNPILFDFDFCGNGWRAYDISMYAFPFGMGCDETKLIKREERKDQFLNGYNKVRAMSESEVNSIALFIPFRRIFNIGTLYISYLPNTWGDSAVIRNVDEDIKMLKKWLELNPIF
ncbi:phosphotransferase [Paenibacillus sp. sptzw28]|uniref:phosphotransferase enzyme family protein n=1 Tax=Paenibacillus sp. sptzw28 TaxID=715179 RepID=UPI001C6ED060|nr:phosphotransferase [Paenibacillus sp. sptzw28]QYR21267.1 phosphotransferase [Paenibacillus sp. sptzw28]